MTYVRFSTNACTIALMDIDLGKGEDVYPYMTHDLEEIIFKGREYCVIQGTRIGGVKTYFTQLEEQGKLTINKIKDETDPPAKTWQGITLPITSRTQLEGKMNLVLFHMVKGKMLCNRCSLRHDLITPDAIAVYPTNILPYSQDCHECGLLVVNIWQSKKGGPLILFPKFVKPEKKK